MANRRMFNKKLIDSDAFLDLPLSAQALYFHLSMRADDDGFIDNANRIQRMIGSNKDDLNVFVPYRGFYFLNPGLAILVFMRVKKMFCGVNLF